ncbi:uncharacterized protein SAPINGB_P000805 [Magnusiomyces paraingens]|uniref:Serine/threonine-protein phosphatase 2A activator n=1 Tax=Magnusiomyces paraingens TaxID=2606893 RepID=A0A5E8B2Z8_9ASCO|nr:uncharacterized protein SAPINGB_P000805 [Saprochaete ingens]VVT45589.1 unnamed protein product [Saprochaete ingens]
MSDRQQQPPTSQNQTPIPPQHVATRLPPRTLGSRARPSGNSASFLGGPGVTAVPAKFGKEAEANLPKPAPELLPIPDTPREELLLQIQQAGYSDLQKYINSTLDLDTFTLKSRAYVRIRSLIQVLSLKVTLKKRPQTTDSESTKRLLRVLGKVNELIDDVPPLEGPRRFGNLAFRTFHDRLKKDAQTMLPETIGQPREEITKSTNSESPVSNNPYIELVPYFLGGFGSRQRLDFGTGHELSFLAFFGGLWAIDLVDPEISGEDILLIFETYFNTIRKLIVKYSLEPAGSHGVWGLDDHFHLPYILGSAQIVNITEPDTPTPRFSPKLVLRPQVVEREKDTNLYFSAIAFINKVKIGPFYEHSPILYDVSSVATWHKIHRGMIKMYVAEVLGKFPVVQHFCFGTGLFPWADRVTGKLLPSTEADVNDEKERDQQEKKAAAIRLLNSQYLGGGTSSHTTTIRNPNESQSVTKAPWATQ